MQLVETTRDVLLKPLSTVVGIVERRNTMPILANLLLRKQGNAVSFVATDLEVQITAQADFGVGPDDVTTTVAARKLQDILRALPETKIRLSLAANKLVVHAGKSRFTLQTLDAGDYPELTQPDAWQVSFTLTQKTLRNLFNSVHFAMAQQDIRYYLNGLLFVCEPTLVRTVATDGHRLAHAATAGTFNVTERHDVIIPRKTVMEVHRLLVESDEPVQIDVGVGQIRFRFGAVELISKLVEGKFPDFARVIPTDYTRHFLISREELQGSLQRAAILTLEKLKGVRLQLSDNLLKISSTNAEQEEAQEEIDVDYNDTALDTGFNVSYLLDILANAKAEETVRCSVQPDGNASMLITLPNDEHFRYVVMPLRI